jgi:hypothetical protein
MNLVAAMFLYKNKKMELIEYLPGTIARYNSHRCDFPHLDHVVAPHCPPQVPQMLISNSFLEEYLSSGLLSRSPLPEKKKSQFSPGSKRVFPR